MNGKNPWKIGLSIGGILGAVFLFVNAGRAMERWDKHVNDRAIHETNKEHLDRINVQVDLKLLPMQVLLSEMNKKLDHLVTQEEKKQ